jgi:ribosomal-protein-alanine N-acetyltransferase
MIVTERLELVPADPSMTQAALEGPPALAVSLGAEVPASWPPDFLDAPALQFTLERLAEGPQQAGWWLHFVVLARGPTGRLLIGSAGYKGPPTPDGTVELGYGVVRDHQRRGYATEAVRGLVRRAFALPEVQRVIAETLPELTPSIGVLRKCGFHPGGEGSEPGVLRFELTRAQYEAGAGAA